MNRKEVKFEIKTKMSEAEASKDSVKDVDDASSKSAWFNNLISRIESPKCEEMIAISLHGFMLELGFRNLDSDQLSIIPDNWRGPAGFSSRYRFHLKEGPAARLMITTLGPLLKIHGVNSGTKETLTMTVKPALYKKSSSGSSLNSQDLERLSRSFKNEVGVPLLNSVKAELGFQVSGLMGLSPEIVLNILSKMNSASVVAMSKVNKYLNSLSQDTNLWKKLFLKEFGRSCYDQKRIVVRGTEHEDDWYHNFKEEHQTRKQQRRNIPDDDDFMIRPPPMFPYPDFSHNPGAPDHPGNIPGFIGGEYDRFPGGGRGLGPGFGPPLGLPRPRFDPPGPNFPQFPPGRGRGGRRGFGGPGFGGGGFGGFF